MLDCKQKIQYKDVLPESINFEEGFEFNIPVILKNSNKTSNLKYVISPQKLVTQRDEMHR